MGSRGRLITLEGGEGAGKSTQASLLVARLGARGKKVVQTREPGGTPLAEAIRGLLLQPDAAARSPLTEALLFNAARSDHLDGVIRPALAAGAWVVCDRFADSTRAYQGAADGLAAGTIDWLETAVLGGTRPDLTLILDLPADVGLARAAGRAGARGDRFEQADLAFHERLRREFLAIAAREPGRCLLIDASLPEAEVEQRVWAAVSARLAP